MPAPRSSFVQVRCRLAFRRFRCEDRLKLYRQRAACDAMRNKMLNSYRAVREAAKERQKATQFAGKDMQGNPKAKSSVSNGTSVSQLIGTPKTETVRTSQFRAKAVGTNREYIDLADKLLREQPETRKGSYSPASCENTVPRLLSSAPTCSRSRI